MNNRVQLCSTRCPEKRVGRSETADSLRCYISCQGPSLPPSSPPSLSVALIADVIWDIFRHLDHVPPKL